MEWYSGAYRGSVVAKAVRTVRRTDYLTAICEPIA
jgi:hypothetical protein